VHSGVFDPRGAERVLAVRRAPRGEKTPPGAVHRRPQQEVGEICGLVFFMLLALGTAAAQETESSQEAEPAAEAENHSRGPSCKVIDRVTDSESLKNNEKTFDFKHTTLRWAVDHIAKARITVQAKE